MWEILSVIGVGLTVSVLLGFFILVVRFLLKGIRDNSGEDE